MKFIITLILLCFSIVSADIRSTVIAKVNSHYITEHDLAEAVKVTAVINHAPENKVMEQKDLILKQVLVNDAVIIDQGKILKIDVPSDEIDNALTALIASSNLSENDGKFVKNSTFIKNKLKAENIASKIKGSLQDTIEVSDAEISAHALKAKTLDAVTLMMINTASDNINSFIDLINTSQLPKNCNQAAEEISKKQIGTETILESKFADLNPVIQKVVEELKIGDYSLPFSTDNEQEATFILICDKKYKQGSSLPKKQLKLEVIQKKTDQAWEKYLNGLKKNAFIEYVKSENDKS